MDMTASPLRRVVIDLRPGGLFDICSDPGIEVICRDSRMADDELYRYGSKRIPEEWLADKPIGFMGDGSEADRTAQAIGKAFRKARGAR
jgi:hypothetical protein